MPDPTPTPEQIAAWLIEAQRKALLSSEADGCLGLRFIRWWHANGRTLRSLRRLGLGNAVWSGVVLTPKGLAVRAVLERGQ